MNAIKMVAVALIVGGLLGLAYGGFSYVKDTHRADIGPLHLQVTERQDVNIPLWASIAAIVGGGFLLVTARKS
jgi:TRAP-type C4-dicarboxylate transport system permease small subunit